MRYTKILNVGSEALLRFVKYDNEIIPVLLLVGAADYADSEIDYMSSWTAIVNYTENG